MPRITWDADSQRFYETGTKNGVLYVQDDEGKYNGGVPWNGLTGVTQSPSGAEATDLYADDIKYLSMRSAEELGLTIEAYTYPDEFGVCDGTAEIAPGVVIGQQSRRRFGFCYRTVIGNDIQGEDYGYKLHLVYGCTASPSEKAYQTINDSPEAITFSWEINTTPVAVKDHKPTSILEVKVTKENKDKVKALEDILYGTDDDDARLPLPDEVATLLAAG